VRFNRAFGTRAKPLAQCVLHTNRIERSVVGMRRANAVVEENILLIEGVMKVQNVEKPGRGSSVARMHAVRIREYTELYDQ